MKKNAIIITSIIAICAIITGILIYRSATFNYMNTIHVDPDIPRPHNLYQKTTGAAPDVKILPTPDKNVFLSLEEEYTTNSAKIKMDDEHSRNTQYNFETVKTTWDEPKIGSDILFHIKYFVLIFQNKNIDNSIGHRSEDDYIIYDNNYKLLSGEERTIALKNMSKETFGAITNSSYTLGLVFDKKELDKWILTSAKLYNRNLDFTISDVGGKANMPQYLNLSFMISSFVPDNLSLELYLQERNPPESIDIPIIPGTQIDNEEYSIRFLQHFPLTFSGYNHSGAFDPAKLKEPQKVVLSTSQPSSSNNFDTFFFAVTPPDIFPFLKVSAVDVNEDLMDEIPNSSRLGSIVYNIVMNPENKKISKLKIQYKINNKRVIIPVDKIPGLPKENENLKDLLDIKIPYIELKNYGDFYNIIEDNLLLTPLLYGFKQPSKYSRVFENVTIRDIINDFRKSLPVNTNIDIDYEKGTITFNKVDNIFIKCYKKIKKVFGN